MRKKSSRDREISKLAMRKLRQERKMRGLCGYCGEKNDRIPKYYCSRCADKHNEKANVNRINKILSLICPHCGKELEDVANMCPECYEKMRIRNSIRHKELIGKGLCVWCAKPTNNNGFKKCNACREKENSKRRSS